MPNTSSRAGSIVQDNERGRIKTPSREFGRTALATLEAKKRAAVTAEQARGPYHKDFAKHLDQYLSTEIESDEEDSNADIRDLFRTRVFIPKLEELSRQAERERQEYIAVRNEIARKFADLSDFAHSHTFNEMEDSSIDECNAAELREADKTRVPKRVQLPRTAKRVGVSE